MSICLHGIGMFVCLHVSMFICIYPCLCAGVGCVLVPVHMSVDMSSPSVNIPVRLFVNLSVSMLVTFFVKLFPYQQAVVSPE